MTLDDEDLFGDHVPERAPKAAGKAAMRKKVVITVEAAPNPSERHGENMGVAGIEFDELGRASWIRFCPINFRHLQHDDRYKKWDVVTVDCVPAKQDGRVESWKPVMATMETQPHLVPGWPTRRGSNRPALLLTQFCAVVPH